MVIDKKILDELTEQAKATYGSWFLRPFGSKRPQVERTINDSRLW